MYLIKILNTWKAYNIVTKNKLFLLSSFYSHTKNNIRNKGPKSTNLHCDKIFSFHLGLNRHITASKCITGILLHKSLNCKITHILIKYMFDYLFTLCLLNKYLRQLQENIVVMFKCNTAFYIERENIAMYSQLYAYSEILFAYLMYYPCSTLQF